MHYQGRFFPKNPRKYRGNIDAVYYRSSWEYATFMWLDQNPGVLSWGSEELEILYECQTDNRIHRYFPDLVITFANKKKYIIEIKPKHQTIEPQVKKRKTKKYITEVLTYVKNRCKWDAAALYANKTGMIFEVWTEETLRSLGIKII